MPRMGTVQKEKYKTLNNVFDLFTEKNLFKLMSQGYFEGLASPLSIGKESNVFTAKHGDETRVVKIYRLQTCDFNRMYDYLKADPRYIGTSRRRREVIFAWAHREYRNLLKAREAKLRVPTVYAFVDNILVMEFIGDAEGAAQKVKNHPPKDAQKFFDDIIDQMRKLYKAGLVHADLSSFNILNLDDKPVFIDMSQSTPLDNPNAMKFLERDVHNICQIAQKWGIKCEEGQMIKKIIK